MPNLRQLTFCRLLNGSACCFRQARYYRHFTCRRRLPLAARLTFLGSRLFRAVAYNTLTIKQKSTLPVSKTRQDKSLFRSLSGAYLPPVESGLCRPALQPPRHHGLPPHLRHYYPPPVSAYARHPFYMTTCAAATAACGPGAKMNLAYATGPFSVPNCPARPSRTTGGLILYGAVGCAATVPHRAHCRSPSLPGVSRFRHFRCYLDLPPIPQGPPRHPSPPGVSRVTRLLARHYGGGRPGTGCLLRFFCVEQEAARSRCAAQQDISAVPYR